MPYIFPAESLEKLANLTERYQHLKQIDLQQSSGIFGRPVFLGGTDVIERKKQLDLLNGIIFALHPNHKDFLQPVLTQHLFEHCLSFVRIVIALCLYVQDQINSKRSVLHCLINESLGINTHNALSATDKKDCFLTTLRHFESPSVLEQLNSTLKTEHRIAISEASWASLVHFLRKNVKLNQDEIPAPFSSLFRPVLATAGYYVGGTIGFTLGGAIPALSATYTMTKCVGTLLVLGQTTPLGVLFIAPPIARQLVNVFLSFTLAKTLATIMSYTGDKIGLGLALPLDLMYQLLQAITQTIAKIVVHNTNDLSGIRIKDGAFILCGMETNPITDEQIHCNSFEQILVVNENGNLVQADESLLYSILDERALQQQRDQQSLMEC